MRPRPPLGAPTRPPRRLLPLLAALLALLAPAAANIMGVDLGLGYVKVAVARPRRGLELVANEQSKRKTPAAVAFTEEGERLFGDAAIAYAAKVPKRAILDGRALIGQCAADAPADPLCARRTLHVDGVADFTGEEVVAMLLAMARSQAAAAVNAPIKDVAVTVPAWYDERERQAIADAARVVGLNCLGVVNANTAAAIKYALDGKARPSAEAIEAEKAKDKKKRAPKTVSQRVMIYDIGASGASASIAEVTTDVKTGVASTVRMLSHASDKGISGRELDTIIINRLADAFDKLRGPDATASRDIPRVMMRLRKESQRVREVLSANTETIVSIASLYDDMDLKTTLARADFESEATSMFGVIKRVAKAALSDAQLDSADLDAVVPNGGASRTPRVQEEMMTALGVGALNKSINTDEATVMGSAFFAASLSSAFQVRKMEIVDVYKRTVSVEIEKEGESGMFGGGKKGVQTVEVFTEQGAKMPSKKTVSLNRKKDFSLRVYLNLDKSGRSRFPQRTLYSQINVKGVADVLSKLKDRKKAKGATPRVALVFHIDRSGMVRIGTAESSVDEVVVVEREVEVKEEKDDKKKDAKDGEKAADDKKDVKDDKNEGDKKEEKDGEEGKDKKDDKKEKPKKKKTKIEKSTQTVVHRSALTIEHVAGEGIVGMQLSGDELKAAQKTLKNLEEADKERVERADALNGLEGFILEARSKVSNAEEDEPLFQVTTETERETLIKAFDDAEDWMYTDDAKQLANLRRKHHELQKLYAPAVERESELTGREEAITALVRQVQVSMKFGTGLVEKLTAAKSKRVDDVAKFVKKCEEVKAWVEEKQMAQAAKALTEEPAVKSKEIQSKLEELRDAERVAKIIEASAASAAKEEAERAAKEEAEKEAKAGDSTAEDGADANANATNAEDSTKGGEEEDAVKVEAGSAKAGAGSSADGAKEDL